VAARRSRFSGQVKFTSSSDKIQPTFRFHEGAQKNFTAFSNYASAEWETNQEQFNEEYYRRVVVKALLFRRTKELVGKQAWYEGGYRANIIAYTIAKFAQLLQFEGIGKLLDFKTLWNRQDVTPAIDRQLMLIAEHVFRVIVAPQGGFQNVTEWCKKELCWTRARDTQIPFVKDLAPELVARDDEQIVKKDAAAQQIIVTGIQAQTVVVELGGDYWRALQTWARQKQLLTPTDESFLNVAASMPRKLPSEKQCTNEASPQTDEMYFHRA
jgi:hypothetical protein